ncbi:MAG: MraY family glycosyltransferase, partial [Chitinispirillia bacterium]
MNKSKSIFFKNKKVIFPYILLFGILLVLILPLIRNQIRNYKMLYSLYLFQLSFLISFLLVPVAMNIGNRFNCLDVPDQNRKLHKNPTPLTGGIAIFFGFVFTILFNFNFSLEMKAILVAGTIIFISGLIDDRYGLSARLRLLIQILCSLIVIVYEVKVTFVPEWWHFGYLIELIISLIWIIGITNSMNFIDGMDGIASGSCVTYGIFFAIIAYITDQSYLMYLSLA